MFTKAGHLVRRTMESFDEDLDPCGVHGVELTFGIAHAATPSHYVPVQQGNYYSFLEGGGS
jgi:hypothetical protein